MVFFPARFKKREKCLKAGAQQICILVDMKFPSWIFKKFKKLIKKCFENILKSACLSLGIWKECKGEGGNRMNVVERRPLTTVPSPADLQFIHIYLSYLITQPIGRCLYKK
jgi:hypothetical protein